MRVVAAACALLALFACSRSELDSGPDATPAALIPCGATACSPEQYCVIPCVGDQCFSTPFDGGQCDDQFGHTCCRPPPNPPYCVDSPQTLVPGGCHDGEPDLTSLPANHVIACYCPI